MVDDERTEHQGRNLFKETAHCDPLLKHLTLCLSLFCTAEAIGSVLWNLDQKVIDKV